MIEEDVPFDDGSLADLPFYDGSFTNEPEPEPAKLPPVSPLRKPKLRPLREDDLNLYCFDGSNILPPYNPEKVLKHNQ